ncbi:VOC family protein [Bradyrhizobium sp.]|uniref:VOC family protein n=1 Tax=Bradyrhizobium sp. TaxID=376 RepID=UPI003C740387
MPRGLDHIVHVVRDLDAAGEFYRRAGFTVGARNRHPWGTHNRIVQVPGFFVELLDVAEPELIDPQRPGRFSFGAFARDFLARREGLAMLVLEGHGAAGDADAFRAAGIGDFKVFDFEREAKRPDGSTANVAFSLAFAADAKAPDIGYFTCQQHHPENFWNPAFQRHPNGVTGIAGVILVSDRPEDHRHFVAAYSGVNDVTSSPSGIAVTTPRGEIRVMNPPAYRMLAGTGAPDLARGARLAAIRFAVRDMPEALAALGHGGIPAIEHGGRVIIPSGAANGATLIFEAVKQG